MGGKISKQKFKKEENKVPEEKPALKINDHDILGWIEECVDFILQHGVQTEGVFRVCGSLKEINVMKQDFYRGLQPLKNASVSDVHTVCGVLKKLLNELSEPLLPNDEQLSREQETSGDSDIDLQAYVDNLPEEIRKCMSSLIQLLNRISKNSDVNRMTADNLGRVLSPTLFRPVTAASLVLMPVQQNLLTRLITSSNTLFSIKKELPDETSQSLPVGECHVTRPVKVSIQAMRANCRFKRFPVRNQS